MHSCPPGCITARCKLVMTSPTWNWMMLSSLWGAPLSALAAPAYLPPVGSSSTCHINTQDFIICSNIVTHCQMLMILQMSNTAVQCRTARGRRTCQQENCYKCHLSNTFVTCSTPSAVSLACCTEQQHILMCTLYSVETCEITDAINSKSITGTWATTFSYYSYTASSDQGF